MRIRQKKIDETKGFYEERRRLKQIQDEKDEQSRREMAALIEKSLKDREDQKIQRMNEIHVEEERRKRIQLYSGSDVNTVEQNRLYQVSLAQQRQEKRLQLEALTSAVTTEESHRKDFANKMIKKIKDQSFVVKERNVRDIEVIQEKKFSLEKMRETFHDKKDMVKRGKLQHEKTRTALLEHNPYAARITADVQQQSRQLASMNA